MMLRVFGGIIAIVCSLYIYIKPITRRMITDPTTATGVYALAGLYLIKGAMTLIAGIIILGRLN
jgi:hypothetical protein